MTFEELENIGEILNTSAAFVYESVAVENLQGKNSMNFSNSNELFTTNPMLSMGLPYILSPEDYQEYNMYNMAQNEDQLQRYACMNSLYNMNNSCNLSTIHASSDNDLPDSTNSSRKKSISLSVEELKLTAKSQKNLPISSKLSMLYKILDGIADDEQVLITARPKNKSKKIRKSNRHSMYRGVSLNGKKYQVMIMGSAKKYFGGIPSERDAAIFYDKLSILTNGLAAKTNFNYRKADLMRVLPELERMEPMLSN
eukprot:CAMPEP_0168342578 /NCGR_PEP_ID=MMETSP0213-20121227/15480_1 /TAXON_ID=151035 /ORGANISM="Euplotes harpa, Strain FSP1.4" /LENGTH=254 /DNA_ID=CAMNT_0008349507 /DNA_START=84 /DNA_END=848 /DNA_ORIENTATION=+